MASISFSRHSLISGTLLLTITGIVSRIIGFFYKIFLSRTIGAENLGIYQLIFPLFAMLLSLSAAGIQTTISRYSAAASSRKEARRYLYLGLFCSLILSLVCCLILYRYAPVISRTFLEEPRCESLIKIMGLALPFACTHSCINGYYYGLNRTAIPSISQLLEQIVRVFGVYVLFQIQLQEQHTLSAADAVWGIVIGEISAALFSLTILRFQKSQGSLRTISKNFFSMAIPLTANRFSLSILQCIETLLIPISLRDFGYSNQDALSIYGILTGMVLSTIFFPAVLSNSLSVMLLPAISKAESQKNWRRIQALTRKTVELCLILGFLCTLAFLLTGTFIGTTLFHNPLAGLYIRILSWISPFLFLSSTLCSILHGLGRVKISLLLNLAGCGMRIAFIIFLIPSLGMRGYLYGILASQIFLSLCAWLVLHRISLETTVSIL